MRRSAVYVRIGCIMQTENLTASERLRYMLKETAFGFKHGQIEIISKETGYTRTAVSRWLTNDALPRTPEERIIVAQKLCVDLIYWEYGINYPSLKNGTVNDASIYRAIFQVLDDKNYHNSVNEQQMDKIKEIVTCANNQTFFKDLVTLVDHLIEFAINKKNLK
ncbi:MAG: hypothetical protein ACI87J_002506 [Colwellia sp.]